MPSHISRRRLLRNLVVFSGAAFLDSTPVRADVMPVSWVSIGPAANFKKGKMTQVPLPGTHQGEEVYIRRDEAGTFLVLSSRCSHRGCVVGWQEQKQQFLCPCHGGRFDAQGKNIGGPPPTPLRVLPTHVDTQGLLLIGVSQA